MTSSENRKVQIYWVLQWFSNELNLNYILKLSRWSTWIESKFKGALRTSKRHPLKGEEKRWKMTLKGISLLTNRKLHLMASVWMRKENGASEGKSSLFKYS